MTNTLTTTITEPGVYQISDAEYHRDPVEGGSLSSTGARRLLPPNCPAKFRYLADHPEEKDEFDFGKAAHREVLGIGADIVIVEAPNWKTKAAQDAKKDARAAGLTPILPKDKTVVTEMTDAIKADPLARRLFRPGHGVAEQTLVWRDRRTGIWRRALLDWTPIPAEGKPLVIVDYKTCDHADDKACEKAIHNYGYHQQADWYLDGAGELRLPGTEHGLRFVFVFQEKSPPYLVNVVEPHPDSLLWGRVRNDKAIDTYRQCTEAGEWPGYTQERPMVASLPPYAITSYERERQMGLYDLEGDTLR